MITKNYQKYLKSLQLKKHRVAEGCFIVEGRKNLLELLNSEMKVERLLLTAEFLEEVKGQALDHLPIEVVKASELVQVGTFKSNNAGLAVVKMRDQRSPKIQDDLTIVLDDIRDPGNLGTIIRIADWYGFKTIICSTTTTDAYSPKVINASMGSFFRVNCFYTDLDPFLNATSRPVIGASLTGENIHQYAFPQEAILVVGNEAAGIQQDLLPHIDKHLKVPGAGGAESLNAAVATAIFCDNFIRNNSSGYS